MGSNNTNEIKPTKQKETITKKEPPKIEGKYYLIN
jgi:hypothetical protein